MQSPRFVTTLLLLILGAGFSIGNVWFAAARSTIPLALVGTVIDKTRLLEKTPGVDDVHLVTFDDGQIVQVDESLYTALTTGESIHKLEWERTVDTDRDAIDLRWSADTIGMAWAMPLVGVVMMLVGVLANCRGRNVNVEHRLD